MSRSKLKSFELLFELEKNKFRCKNDVIVLTLHCLLSNIDYDCVGQGEQWDSTNDKASELLPSGWNSNPGIYTLRYKKQDATKYLLKVINAEPALLVNLLDVANEVVKGTTLKAEDFIDNIADYKSALKDKKCLLERLNEVLESQAETSKEKSKQDDKDEEYDPLRVPRSSVPSSQPDFGSLRDPFNIGRSDLDPFGSVDPRHGMLFDPFRITDPFNPGAGLPGGRLPRGAVPPGARFDPFAPNFPGSNRGPNPDHFHPPDYNDMFS